MILANFNVADSAKMAAFHAKYGVPGNVAILGPLSGKLANSSESVKLSKPGTAAGGTVPYILVEGIDYQSTAPWPPEADGAGALLQRRNASQYGNDPINWAAAIPAAGTAPVSAVPPTIVTSPPSRVGFLTQTLSFNVTATGTAPLIYQWRVNGANITGATNPVLTLTNLQFTQAGVYSAVVFNSAGSASTSNAVLTVQLPLLITQQPQSQIAIQGSNVAFTVSAVGNGLLSYQWRLNDTNIPLATSPTLTLTNVSINQTGTFVAMITDGLVTSSSAPATLAVVVEPLIIQQPLSVSVPIGGTATLSVMITNNASLPVGYRWRRGTTTVASNAANTYVNFLTITNVQSSAFYIVTVFNAARPAGIASALTSVSVLPDADLDGIPDAWETANGFLSNDPSDASLDTDHDGMSNLQEYIAGTNPRDPLSYLKVDRVTLGSQATIQFMALSNHTYTVELSDNLNAGSWTRLADVLARTSNRVESIIDSHPATNRFYRLVTPQKP
jgi:hypothetical protein